MDSVKLYRSEPIDVTVTPTATQFNFQDFPQLRNAPIMAMELFTADDMPYSPLSKNPILPTTGSGMAGSMLTCYLSLYENVIQNNSWGLYIDQHPVISFHRMSNGTDPFTYSQQTMAGRIIQWQKSFINLLAPVGGETTYAVYFLVYYADPVTASGTTN